MPLTFTYDGDFLEQPDSGEEDAVKLAEAVMAWWHTDFTDDKYDNIQRSMVQLAQELLEKSKVPAKLRNNNTENLKHERK